MDNLIVLSYNWDYLERFWAFLIQVRGIFASWGQISLEGSLLGNRLFYSP